MYSFKLLFLFLVFSFNAASQEAMRQTSLSIGINKSIWNNGNHKGWHSQIQYVESVSKLLAVSLTAGYGKGLSRDVFVSIRPAQGTIIRYDSHGWAASIEPAVGISSFKNKTHELTLFGGLTGGVYLSEEYRGYI